MSKYTKNPLVITGFLLFLLFSISRFYDLGARPMHNDEGVNTHFLIKLVKSSQYQYDPKNYHGPILYYIQLIPTWITGLIKEGPFKFKFTSTTGITDVSVRSGVSMAGILLLLGLLLAHRRIGTWGALVAFGLMGLSCNSLYYSRYFIHEIYLVLFSLGLYLSAITYRDSGKRLYAILAAGFVAFMLCTKETSVITFFVLGFSFVCTEILHSWLMGHPGPSPVKILKTQFHSFFKSQKFPFSHVIWVFALVWFLFFTSFLTNPRGAGDFFQSYFHWFGQGTESGHIKPFSYFIQKILIRYELALLVLSLMGLVVAFIKNEKHGIYLSFWTLGMVGAYSLIPYKTPWLVLNMLLPMALLSGYAFQSLLDMVGHGEFPYKKRAPAVLVGGLLLLVSIQLPQAMNVVYEEYDNNDHEPPYVHTVRDVYQLVGEVDRLAKASGLGTGLPIKVITRNQWPLPYYLRNYTAIGYWNKFSPGVEKTGPLLIVDRTYRKEIEPLLKRKYMVKSFDIRHNLPLDLLIEKGFYGGKETVSLPPLKFLEAESPTMSLEPGMKQQVFSGRDWKGKPLKTAIGVTDFNFRWDNPEDRLFQPPFSSKWTGYIKIPRDGVYTFSLESDDGSWLFLHSKEVINNGGVHALLKQTRKVELAKGYHWMEIDYFDSGGGAVLKFGWIPPHGRYQIVPKEVLYTPHE